MKAKARASRLPSFVRRIDATRFADYRAALNPPKIRVTPEQYEQQIYDAVWRDQSMPRAAVLRWAARTFAIETEGDSTDEIPGGDDGVQEARR